MQTSLEAEARGKAEAMRMKKKLEQDLNELESALDSANRGRAEADKNIKKLQQQMREHQQQVLYNMSDFAVCKLLCNVYIGSVGSLHIHIPEWTGHLAGPRLHIFYGPLPPFPFVLPFPFLPHFASYFLLSRSLPFPFPFSFSSLPPSPVRSRPLNTWIWRSAISSPAV